MLRIGAIFVVVCMVLIAASVGAVAYLGLALDVSTAGIVALSALVALVLYNTIDNRLRDRREIGDQIADLSRGTGDLARQVAELSRRFNAVETRVDTSINRARSESDPLASEIGELGLLVQQLADTVAHHDVQLRQRQAGAVASVASVATAAPRETVETVVTAPLPLSERDTVSGAPRFKGLRRDEIIDLVRQAIEDHRIDLYLQPIVTLPQRKVRYYEAISRLRMEDGEIVAATDFLPFADAGGVLPKLDNLLLFRCVQVTRRLRMKNHDVGVFCNISPATLTDAAYFKQMLDFMQANRALASALTFEFSQPDYRNFGPIERESMGALAESGFRFSLDHIADLRFEPRDLAANGIRFLKAPAKLLLNHATAGQSDIHPEDLADLLARYGIDLIAEHIESERMVVDLLDFDVRFGQGFLFSPPRPVRAEALQSVPDNGVPQPGEYASAGPPSAA
jgi:cyclic-di-GMP phosphodiesterase TipF (flagellum assembly factor)